MSCDASFRFSLTLLSTLLPGLAQAWWQPDWAYRKPVTIDAGPQGGAIGGDAGRTPVLLRLHTGNFKLRGRQRERRRSALRRR